MRYIAFGVVMLLGCGGEIDSPEPAHEDEQVDAGADGNEECSRAPEHDRTCRWGVAFQCPDRVRCFAR